MIESYSDLRTTPYAVVLSKIGNKRIRALLEHAQLQVRMLTKHSTTKIL